MFIEGLEGEKEIQSLVKVIEERKEFIVSLEEMLELLHSYDQSTTEKIPSDILEHLRRIPEVRGALERVVSEL